MSRVIEVGKVQSRVIEIGMIQTEPTGDVRKKASLQSFKKNIRDFHDGGYAKYLKEKKNNAIVAVLDEGDTTTQTNEKQDEVRIFHSTQKSHFTNTYIHTSSQIIKTLVLYLFRLAQQRIKKMTVQTVIRMMIPPGRNYVDDVETVITLKKILKLNGSRLNLFYLMCKR